MIDFSDLHFIFWLFILAFCIVYKRTMNSEFENVSKKCKGNQFVKLKLLPIFKTNVFDLYFHRQVKTVLQIVKR